MVIQLIKPLFLERRKENNKINGAPFAQKKIMKKKGKKKKEKEKKGCNFVSNYSAGLDSVSVL